MDGFDRVVATMMRKFGRQAIIRIPSPPAYDPSTSDNSPTVQDYTVNALLFDYLRKEDGLGSEKNTLIQSGDKQIYIQPTQKVPGGVALPTLSPNKDLFVLDGSIYKIVFLKQLNPSMTTNGCYLYELYVRA